MTRLTKASIAQRLFFMGRTVEEIALTLKTTPAHIAEVLGQNPYESIPDRLHRRAKAFDMMLDALRSLQNPTGHIYHGPGNECTGECKAVQEAVRAAEGKKND